MFNVWLLLIGGMLGAMTAVVAVYALGVRRVAELATSWADALDAVQCPKLVETRPQVVASLVRDGWSWEQADDAVSQAADGPRTFHAWKRRAAEVLREV